MTATSHWSLANIVSLGRRLEYLRRGPNQELLRCVLFCGGGGLSGCFYDMGNAIEVSRDSEFSKVNGEQ